MTTQKWLNQAVDTLTNAGIGTARLDALVLLEDVLNKDRAHLLAHPETILTTEQQKVLKGLIQSRAKHEPLAYIREKTEFYGREFKLNHDVLEPRPESETMIDLLKKLKLPAKPVIADIGTGSGAIAITAKLEIPTANVFATDIDENCLVLTRQNAKKYETKMTILHGNLLEPLKKPVDVILANLPYVPDHYQINQAALQEPRIAIFGGEDGLELYRQLFKQLKTGKYGKPVVFTESLPFQHQDLAKIASQTNYKQTQEDDFIQVFF